ncbi:MAG: ATP-binding cassette domain-containing protein, partial [Pseudomonadota bacterium]
MTLQVDIGLTRRDFTLKLAFQTGAGVTTVFGPSGSGKTTLLNIIAGLIRPNFGYVALGDRIWNDGAFHVPAHRRRVGYVFQ